MDREKGILTGDENILVRSTDELHGFLREESHVFVDCIVGDVGICGVEEGNEDVKENWSERQYSASPTR